MSPADHDRQRRRAKAAARRAKAQEHLASVVVPDGFMLVTSELQPEAPQFPARFKGHHRDWNHAELGQAIIAERRRGPRPSRVVVGGGDCESLIVEHLKDGCGSVNIGALSDSRAATNGHSKPAVVAETP